MADLIRRQTQKPFYTVKWTINTAMHGQILYNLLHPRKYSGIYFTGISANQIHLSCTHIFCNVKRKKVLHQVSQFLGIKLSARSHVLRTEVKCMNVYQHENACSKYLMLSTNVVSHYVSLCKMAFGCVNNMTFLNFVQDNLSSMKNNA